MNDAYTRSDHIRLVATNFPDREHCIHCGAIDGLSGATNLRGHWWTIGAIVHEYGVSFRTHTHYLEDFGDALPQLAGVTDGVCGACRKKGIV